jgi:uncharacterized protein (TIGR02594 family)
VAELLPDGKLNPVVRSYFKHTKFPEALINVKTAWCAAALCTWLERAGIRSPRTARAADFARYGTAVDIDNLLPGDIVGFSPHDPDAGGSGHVALFVGWSVAAGKARVLGGNQANCVCVDLRDRDKIAWARRTPLPVST